MLFAYNGGSKRRIRKQKWEKIGRWGKERGSVLVEKRVTTLTFPGPNSELILLEGPVQSGWSECLRICNTEWCCLMLS